MSIRFCLLLLPDKQIVLYYRIVLCRAFVLPSANFIDKKPDGLGWFDVFGKHSQL